MIRLVPCCWLNFEWYVSSLAITPLTLADGGYQAPRFLPWRTPTELPRPQSIDRSVVVPIQRGSTLALHRSFTERHVVQRSAARARFRTWEPLAHHFDVFALPRRLVLDLPP